MRLCDLPPADQPRARIAALGAAALSDAEILALILPSGAPGADSLQLAQALLAQHGGWHGLLSADLGDLGAPRGMGPARAATLKAALEIGRRVLRSTADDRLQIRSPTDAATMLMLEMGHLDQEHLRTVLLDTKNRVQQVATIYIGSVNSAIIRVGEVFKEAIRRNSTAIILAHNHPSGDPTPSPEDILITRQIVEAGKLLDIEILDHIVVGKGRFVSMRERNLGFSC